jgi:cytidine deaminase
MTAIELVNKAIEGRKRSYSPYSKFAVGAALLMKDGKVIEGCNIENAAYGDCICAERSAMFTAHNLGYNLKEDVVAMAITGQTNGPISPCGSCRQVMNELLRKDTPVYLSNLEGKVKETTVAELLPYGFDDLD